ncbi:unnamed protein product [marine sediment metagenome]|uniref:SpoVT-AbrB domain-containing protein n=1 Tax=marine sediment metagenome TaxID=412755 RepID=X1JM78_9ZZZZ
MELKTKIKGYGNTSVIVLTKENLEINDFKEGDVVNVQITKSKEKKKKK